MKKPVTEAEEWGKKADEGLLFIGLMINEVVHGSHFQLIFRCLTEECSEWTEK